MINTAFYSEIEQVICFTLQALIMTPLGPKPAGALRSGDKVVTRDNGAKKLAWIGHKTLGLGSLITNPELAPVTIAAGALGHGQPERDLTVPPNHCIVMRGEMNRLLFDASEVLLAAKHLVGRPGMTQSVPNSFIYLNLMFEEHELIMSEGVWTDSFQPAEHAMKAVESDQRDELFTLFPELKTVRGIESYGSARQSLKGFESEILRAELQL